MVSILPGARSAWDVIGQQIGTNLNQVMPGVIERKTNRENIQRSLSEIKKLSKDKSTSPIDLSLSLMEAGAGIPGSERYLATILPMLLKQQQGERVFGKGQDQGQPTFQRQPLQDFNPTPGRENFQRQPQQVSQEGQPAVVNQEGLPQPGPKTSQGVLPRIMPAEEIKSLVENAARNDPEQAAYWQNYYAGENKIAQEQRDNAAKTLQSMGVSPAEIPEAISKIGDKYGWMTDLNDWAVATKRDYDEYKNNKTQLANATTPGFWRGLVSSPEDREKSLSTLEEPVKNLVKLGFEQEVRKQLSGPDMDLSPTEVELAIHPLSKNFENNFNKIPKGPFAEYREPHKRPFGEPFTFKSYAQVLKDSPETIDRMNDKLADFLKNNITEDTSLLPVRHKLWAEKGYDWRQFMPALSKARAKGLKLSTAQQAELTELSNQPPRDSISDVFLNWGRWMDYIKGQK